MRRFGWLVAVLTGCTGIVSGSVAAQEPAPLAAVSPLWVGHLRPEGLELDDTRTRGWIFALSFAYGNTFSTAGEVIDIHNDLDGPGEPLSREVFDRTREVFPERDVYSIDTEIGRLDLEAMWSGAEWFAGVRAPIVSVGGSPMDSWATWMHDFLGVSNAGRDFFPERRTVVALAPVDGGDWWIDDDQGFRLTAVTGWGGRRWAVGDHGFHRLWATISTAVGGNDPWGDGGFSTGLRWAFGSRSDSLGWYGGLGWTVQGGDAGTLGKAADTFHAWLGGDISLGKNWALLALFRADGSVFADVDPGKAGRTTGEFALGFAAPLGEAWRLRMVLGEDFPGMGIPPDFSIQAAVVWKPKAGG